LTCPEPVLALGGYLQVEPCLALADEAHPAAAVGDLDTEAARARLLDEARGLEARLARRAAVVAVDLHPDYPSTWMGEDLAAGRGARLVRIQHHLAHAAAVLGEHERFPARGERVAAVVLDGTGYGPDAVAWGCEWLLLRGDLAWSRPAHGNELPLVGGERAVREPWRVACAALALTGEDELLLRTPLAARVGAERCAQLARLARRSEWPHATGAGRVFEAAGALLGLCTHNTFEGEAAVMLEALAAGHDGAAPPWPELELAHARPELPTAALLTRTAARLVTGEPLARVAAGFHAAFARLAAELTARVLPSDVRTVALGGGCLVNRLLAPALADELAVRGFEPLLPRALPPGDRALAYGQAVLTAAVLERGSLPRHEGGA
jgi:hydrogenase maturation protein HypF